MDTRIAPVRRLGSEVTTGPDRGEWTLSHLLATAGAIETADEK
jgi:hypothetical protein